MSAILFLLVLVFNFYGYRVVIAFMEKSNDTVMAQKLDQNDYSEDDLITIKTKLNLPYYSSSPQFERAYGSVNLDGQVYEYVQKRVFNDTLELRCLPNGTKTALHDLEKDLTKASADGQGSVPLKKGASTLKLSLPDYCQMFETVVAVETGALNNFFLSNESFAFADFTKQQEQPPQAI